MKCPKCNYLSFEAGERCRNCGYDFSLSAPPPDDPAGDLPLFDDRPLVSVPATPRAPLSVRRTGPRPNLGAGGQDPARLRSRHAPPAPPRVSAELDLPLDAETELEPETEPEPAAAIRSRAPVSAAPIEPQEPAPPGRRLLATLIDLTLIVAIDAAVLYFTLRSAGLDMTLGDFILLPLAPIVAFLVLLNGGYVVMFTAATGQTIGKMAAGIRVVGPAHGDAPHDRVTFGRAVLRTAAYFASLLPAGLGFIPAFIGPRDHRALHDRLADTRVVRA